MPNNGRSNLEVLVSLGLLGALNLIQWLKLNLLEAVSPNTSSMRSITRELDSALRLVNKLRAEMNSSFSTSTGAKKFLEDYDKVFEHIGMIVSSFSTLNLDDLKLPNEILTLVSKLKSDIKGLSLEITRIESGKIGKVFDDVNNVDFGKVRLAAKDLEVELSLTTFTLLSDSLTQGINEANQKISELLLNLLNLLSFINNPQINKDSIMNAIVGSSDYALMTNRTLTKTGAEDLRAQLAGVYKEYLGEDALKLLNLNLLIKLGASTNKLFETQCESIEKSTDALIEIANSKKTDVSKAILELTDIKKMLKNPDGTRTNWQDRIPLIDKIKEQYKDLVDFSSLDLFVNAKTGKGILGYIDLLILELLNYSSSVDVSTVKAELQSKIETLINDALTLPDTTVDRISNLKDFKSNIEAAIQLAFGRGFNINWEGITLGTGVKNAIELITTQIFNLVNTTEIKELDHSIQELQNTANNYSAALAVVTTVSAADTAALDEKKAAAAGLSLELSKLLLDTLALANGALGKGLLKDKSDIEQARDALQSYISTTALYERASKSLTNVSNAVARWMGFYLVLNLTKRAILDMKTHVQELDKVMTQIAVVTNMSSSDLWGQISNYSEIARQYGVAIKGVYEVSLIYYQLGLNKGDVMNLTTETLKMARIAGIDYATAADYMTTAVRGFKLEMNEAAHVTDVFSNLAAHTASDTEELATAISKTAASAEAVGASFEATSAMIATMVSVTRESATNIGTALKSVISRYGEMTSDPSKLVDAEGEEMSLNRVDKALLTIGISIHDVNGQFRDFDDVILELGDKWDSIDKNAQRYIATIMAGNRLQSRFLALVGNVEEYRRALELANNSEDVGELLVLKTLDSVDAKIERMKVTIQEFYTSSGILDLYKGILDTITNIISGANELPKAFGNLPVTALALGTLIIAVIKNIAQLTIAILQNSLSLLKSGVSNTLLDLSNLGTIEGQKFGRNWFQAALAEMNLLKAKGATGTEAFFGSSKIRAGLTLISTAASGFGAILNVKATSLYGASTSVGLDQAAGLRAALGGGISNAISGAISGALMSGGNPIVAGISAIASALPSLISGISMYNVTLSRRLELAEKAETEAKLLATLDKGKVNDLLLAYDKLNLLSEALYQSAESMAEYHEYMNLLADSYPSLVSAMEISGDQIVTLESLERALALARADASASTLIAVLAERDRILLELQAANKLSKRMENSLFNDNLFENYTPGLLMTGLTVDNNIPVILGGTGIKSSSTVIGDNSELSYNQLNELYALLLMYNKAIEQGLIENREKIELPEYNDKLTISEVTALYDEHIEDIQVLANTFLFNLSEALALYKSVLKTAVDENKNLNYAELTGIKDLTKDNLDEVLDNLSVEKLFEAIEHTRKIAGDNIELAAKSVEAINAAETKASASTLVLSQLKISSITETGIDLLPYSSFLTSMLSREADTKSRKNNVNFMAEGNYKLGLDTYNDLVKYIEENSALANELFEGLNFSLISSLEELNEFLESKNFTTDYVSSNIINSIQKDYLTTTQSIRNNFYNSIKAYIGSIGLGGEGRTLWRLFDLSNTEDNITGEVATILQSLLPQYKQLIDKGYTIAADNYLNGLIALYQLIGQLSDDLQHDIAPILRELDLTDVESIDTAIKSFETLGLTDIVSKLTEIRERVYTNIGLTISSMIAETSKTAEEAEKALANIGKGMDYSDALKAALEIIAKSENKDRTADNLIEWNADLNKWVLTSEALEESYRLITEANQDRLAAISRLAEIILDSSVLDAIKSLTAESTGEDITEQLGKLEGLSESEQNVLSLTLQLLLDLFKTEKKENENLEWDTWIIDALNQYDQKELEFLLTYLQNSPLQYIASMDFDAIAGGTASDTIYESFITYMNILGGEAAEKAVEIWEALKEANFKPLEDVLGIKISDTVKKLSGLALALQYLTAIEDLTKYSHSNLWSKETLELIGDLLQDTALRGRLANILRLYTNLKNLINTSDYTLEQYNSDIAALTTKLLGLGQEKATTDLLTGGFKLEDFSNYLNEYIKDGLDDIDQYFKDGQFIAAGYEGLFEVDANGEYLIAAGHTIDEVLQFFNLVLGVSIDASGENWKKYFKSETDKAIADLDEADTGKLAANIVSQIASGKVGERINLEGLPEELKGILDKNGDSIFEITNEAVRDNILLALDPNAFDEEYKQVVKELQESIKSKRNLGQALTGMASKTVTVDDFLLYAVAMIGTELENPDQYLTDVLKYVYDPVAQVYNATKDSITGLKGLVNTAKLRGASPEYISELEATIADLEWELGDGKYYDAVANIVSNYLEVSDDAKRAFELAFADIKGVDSSKIFTLIENTNNYKVNIAELLAQVGNYMNDAAKDMIFLIATGYMDGISTAASLRTLGTNSLTEMLDFAKSYTEITGEEKLYTDLFSFDSELHTYILKQDEFASMISKAKEKVIADLKAAGYTDEGQIEQIANETILAPIREFDFSSIADNSATNADRAILRGYLESAGATDIDTIMSELSLGIFTSLETLLPNLDISDTIKRATRASLATSMQTAINDLIQGVITPEDIATLNEYGIEVTDGIKAGSDEALTAAGLLVKQLIQFVEEGAIALTEVLLSMQLILEQLWVNAGFGRGKAAIDILTDGLSISELGSFMDTWGGTLGDVFDEVSQLLKGPLANVFEIDKFTGELIYKSGKSAKEILQAYEQLMGIALDKGSAEYRNAISAIVDEQIAKLDAKDFDKLAALQLSALSSAKVGDRINLSQVGITIRNKLRNAGLTISNNILEVTSELSLNQALLSLESLTTGVYAQANPEIAAEAKRIIEELRSKMNLGSALTNIIGETIELSAGESLQLALHQTTEDNNTFMRSLGFLWDELNQRWIATDKSIISILALIDLARAEGKDLLTVNNLLASLNNLRQSLHNRQYNAVSELVSNYTNLSEEAIAAFLTAFSGWGINIRDFISTDEWGRNRVDLSGLNLKLAQVGYDVNELFLQEIAAIGDSYLLNISTGVSLLSSGTNNLNDLGSFVENYNLMLGTNLAIENVSYYDNILKAFTIRPEYIKKYIEAQALALKDLGLIPEALINLWVKDNTIKAALNNIDIGSFLSSNRTLQDVDKLGRAIEAYYELLGNSIENAVKFANMDLLSLLQGGLKAADLALRLHPTLTESELAEIYSSAINRWNDALGEVEGIILGQVVTGELRLVLSLLKMVDANGVVNETFNAVEVYSAIYEQMSNTAGATVSDLNNAYAKLLTANDLKRMDVQEALENAADMSFDTLALLYSNYGKNIATILPDLVKSGTVGLTGFGGIRIFDIDAFLGTLGLDASSPEYYELRNEYADAMTEFYNNTNNIIDSVAELILGLAEIKPGKAVNLSYLESVLPEGLLEELIGSYGELILNGIYVFNETVDIPKLIQATAEAAAKAGKLIPELMAELADTISDMLADIASLISGGISGSLSNADALKLSSWANLYGVNLLDFTTTVDGLKLSTNSAKELYLVIKNIDDIQGSIVFDALKESLIETLDEFKTISALSIYMQDLRNKIANTDKYSDEKIKLYEQELALAEEILAARSTTEDDSFKFMDNKIPSGLNNPLNYWSNWYDAFEKMQATTTGTDKGKMAYEDFYNIVTEMGNIASYTAEGVKIGNNVLHNSEDAANLIEQAASKLTTMSTGEMGVKLSEIGIDFSSGVDGMAEGVDKGIDALADELIDMLNSMIQLLETVVAMEKLGDIDIDEDNVLDLGEIFNVKYDPEDSDRIIEILNTYTDKFQIAAKKILDSAKDNEDLTKALDEMKVTINGQVVTMRLMFEDATDGVKDIDIDAEAYTALLNSFYQAYLSGDYDLDHLFESIKSVLAGTGFEGEVDIGDMHLTFKAGTVIEWDKNNKAIINGKATQFTKGDEDKIISAMAAVEFGNLLNNNYTIEDSGEVIYHGVNDTSVTIEVKDDNYSATFSSGGSVSAHSRGELAAAIKTYLLIKPEDYTEAEGSTTTESQLAEFEMTFGQDIKVNVKAEVKEGQWTVTEMTDAEGNQLDLEKNEAVLEWKEKAEQGLNETLDLKGLVTTNVEYAAENPAELPVVPEDEVLKQVDDNKTYAQEHPAEQDITILSNLVREAIYDNVRAALNNPARLKLIVTREDNVDLDVESTSGVNVAKGNVALAKGTLMGELGPELYVTGGRYYIAGQNGAEFVDLPDDAIVFNHLLTRKLMSTGTSSRGKPTTSEEMAVSFATGNWNGGEAMASASAALTALKQLRSMWQSLKSATALDLAGAAGSGGGGGGSNTDDTFLEELEIWYNWLQEIDKLETKITYQETLRSKIQSDMVAHGLDYFKSQSISLKALKDEVAVQEDLYKSLLAYFNDRRELLNSQANPFSALYTFDEQGQLKYQKGMLEKLSYMSGTDEYGAPNMTASELYDYIVNTLGISADYMKYDSSGKEIDTSEEGWEVNAVLAFWDRIESDKEEMQTLYDSVEEHKEAMIEKLQEINEELKDMEDNAKELEGKVYDAIVDLKQRVIDEFLDTRDLMEENNQALLDGLNEQLENERAQYDAQENADDLLSLLRQLAILQRSGGSAAEIADLQNQIVDKLKDIYFETLENEINTLELAMDAEIEKMDEQIDLMTETLAYQKENGLLNSEIYKVLSEKTPEEIANFIATNDSKYWGKTPTDFIQSTREDLFSAQRYTEMMELFGGIDKLIDYYTNLTLGQEGNDEEAAAIADEINGTGGSNDGGSEEEPVLTGNASVTGVWKQDSTGWWYEDSKTGEYPTNAWKKIDGKWYHFDERGYMQTGWFEDTDGKWYYLGADGAMVYDTTLELDYLGVTAKHTFDASGAWVSSEPIITDNELQQDNGRGWHVPGVKEVFGSKLLALNYIATKYSKAIDEDKRVELQNGLRYYSTGGLNTETGLAMLHGTNDKPEAVLNAEQTQILRDEILSNKPTSLLSLLSAWRESIVDSVDVSNITNDNGVNIEKAEVVMQVSQINNDYDAQRAGELALEQIMKVARKSAASNRIGR